MSWWTKIGRVTVVTWLDLRHIDVFTMNITPTYLKPTKAH